MLLTRSRRQWLYGIGFVMLWLLIIILFWGMTEIERVDAPPGLAYFAVSTCRLGPIEWVRIKAYDSAVITGIVTSYSFDYHIPGIACGVAWTQEHDDSNATHFNFFHGRHFSVNRAEDYAEGSVAIPVRGPISLD